MKQFFTGLLLVSYLGMVGATLATDAVYYGGKCSPTGKCTACKNCTGCKNCAKDGGTCSIYRKR